MNTVANAVAAKLAKNEQAEREVKAQKDEGRRDEVRQAASAYLKRWGRSGDLPQGRPGDSGHCVFANALGGEWDGTTWSLSPEVQELGLPEEVQEFITRFDAGEYPDLVSEEAEELVEGSC